MVQSTFISSQGCREIVRRLSWSPGLSCPGPEQHCCRLAPLWTPPPPPWGSHPVEEQSQGGQNFWSSRRLWRGSRPRTPRGSLPCPPRPPCAPWSIAGADFDWQGGEADRRWLIVEVHLHSQGGRKEEEDRRRERLADAGRRRDSDPWWLTTVSRSDDGWLLWLRVDLRLLWRISHQPGSFICNDRESRKAGRKFD